MHALVQVAFQRACLQGGHLTPAARSAVWVAALAEELHEVSQHEHPGMDLVTFCRSDPENRRDFRTNELLFDILIAEARTVPAVRGSVLRAVVGANWVVESELNPSDSRQVLLDLNKLVLARSRNKMLVISAGTAMLEWAQGVMSELLDPADSNVYLVTIPHPSRWCAPPEISGLKVFQLAAGKRWLQVPA